MYREVRHGIVEPVRVRPILRRLLLAQGVLLILVTIVLLILWRKAVLSLPVSSSTFLCSYNLTIDMPPSAYPPCGPTAAEIALPGKYAHAALVTGAVGLGCLVGTYVLGRRSQAR